MADEKTHVLVCNKRVIEFLGNLNTALHTPWLNKEDREAVKRKKNDQGNHECEVLGPGFLQTESANAWDVCTKNPRHANFIPAPEFCVDHLPESCAGPVVVERVRAVAALTARLRVSYTSRGRPDGYTFSQHRGSDILHTGSGWVREVTPGSGPCQCPQCRHSAFPSHAWFKLCLETACHVVYNTEEARATKVDFFYDDKRSNAEGWTRTVAAVETLDVDEKGDTCTLICATHNDDLVKELQMYLTKIRAVKLYGPETVWFSAGYRYLCVVVSHPHGQPKQVTVAKNPPGTRVDNSRRYFTYMTDTCPGSSGAPVIVVELGRGGRMGHSNCHLSLLPPHSQWLPDGSLNQSAASSSHTSEVLR